VEYILITFVCGELAEDLKVPAFVPVKELIELLCEVIGVNGSELHAEPRGIILDKSKTLLEQGVLHGSLLTLG